MAAVTLVPADLAPFATIDATKAAAMIADALAMAALVAPCITSVDFAFPDAAKAVIRGAVLRWNDTGSGAFQSTTTGPYGATVDTRQPRRGMFWPSEIEQLRSMCSASGAGAAFTIEPGVQASVYGHASVCPALTGGACLCGYALSVSGYCSDDDEFVWRA